MSERWNDRRINGYTRVTCSLSAKRNIICKMFSSLMPMFIARKLLLSSVLFHKPGVRTFLYVDICYMDSFYFRSIYIIVIILYYSEKWNTNIIRRKLIFVKICNNYSLNFNPPPVKIIMKTFKIIYYSFRAVNIRDSFKKNIFFNTRMIHIRRDIRIVD